MKGKNMIMTLLCALLVGLVPPSSAHAEEVQEWSNFAEWCYYNGVDLNDLPVEYDDSKGYVLAQWGRNGSYKYDYLFVFDLGADLTWYASNDSNYGTIMRWNISDFSAVYRIQYKDRWFDYTDWETGAVIGWQGVSASNTYHTYCATPKYSDVCIPLGSSGVKFHKTSTGESVDFQFAKADISDSLKTILEGYPNYVVAQVPYRANDWRSGQPMIAVSNGNKVILRSENYNQIHFTTGTGYEAGQCYIYCSECCYWSELYNYRAYILGDTVVTGGNTPTVLYSSCDIYYEEGITYGLTVELWQEAVPYDSSVTPTPMPTQQEVVTTGFPRLFEVTDVLGYVREYADSDSAILCAFAKGKGGLVTGVEYDNSGDAWYRVDAFVGGERYMGYILAETVYVGYSVPSVGGGESPTPTPTLSPEPTAIPPISAGQATVLKDRTGVYEEPSAQTQLQHYLYKGANVYVVEVLENDWYYIRYEVGGLSQVGYIYGENVDYNAENGVASDLVGNDVIENVEEMLDMVKVVPVMIAVLFSFLPPWCLAVVGVGFSLLIVLIIYKCARG